MGKQGRCFGWAVAALTAWAVAAGGGDVPLFRLLDPGERIPSFTLEDLAGREHRLGGPGAGPELLLYWSVFCPNCKEVMPEVAGLHREWAGRGLTTWAINVDGDRFSNAVGAYLQEADLPFPVVYDRLDGQVLVAADPLGVTKTPTLYLADARGRVVLRQAVEIDLEAVRKALADAHGP